jgi:hypothetical protein
MSGMKFLYDNLVDQATLSLTVGSENSQFPLNNILNDATVVKFRSQTNACTVLIDLQQTRTINVIAIANDAVDQIGLTSVIAKTSLTTDFTTSVPRAITVDPEQGVGFVEFVNESKRYVQLQIVGNGTYCELGKVFVGQSLHLSEQSLSIDSFKYGYIEKSNIQGNDYGQKFINKRNKQKTISGNIKYCNQLEQSALDDMFIFVGTSLPLWLILDPSSEAITDGVNKLSIYGYLETIPDWSADGGQHYSTSLRLVQVI